MLKLCLALVLCLGGSVWAYPPLPNPRSEDEALFIRRIIDFWRDKEYALASAQIKAYLKDFEQSPFADHFLALLGDMAMQKKAFLEAYDYYDKIENDEIKKYVQPKKWQALYQLERYSQLYQEITAQNENLEEEEMRFYFAEAALREAYTLLNYPAGQETAEALCQQALPFYESLLANPTFASHAKLAMASIHRILNQHAKAAALYLELAETENNKDILLHAASVLLQCDKPKAAQIYKKLAHEKCGQACEAAFQWLLLLAEEEDWETLEQQRELFVTKLDKKNLQYCYFYLGMLSFEKKMFSQASVDLQKCVGHHLPDQHEKKALLAILASAKELGQCELCSTYFDTLYAKFPDARPEACCLLAATYQKAKENTRAYKMYEKVTHEFPETPFAEKAAVEMIRLLVDQKKYAEAHNVLLDFLEIYPTSTRKTEMVRLAIDLSLALVAEEEVYSQLATDLERGLQSNLFYGEEKKEKQFLLAKAYLKLGKTHASLQLLQNMTNPDPLLLAYCYIKEGTSPEKIIDYGEKALLSYPEEDKLHIYLFNAYLELAKENSETKFNQKGAEHLNAVIDTFPISLENRLWLAHYFAKEDPLRALPILETLVETESNLKRFDVEAFLLASLYAEHNRVGEAQTLLEKIVALKQMTQLDAKLKLADVYALQGKAEEAILLYQKLEEAAQLSIAYAARLHLARLDFAHAPEKNLKKLQDLAIRKSLINEPVHLEAALDYAELKASTYPENERPLKLLELFFDVKEAFTRQDDIWSKDYHANRELMPEKDLIYQAYMRYLDARMYLLQAELVADPLDCKTKQNAARALFSTLRHGKYAVSKYIKEKASAIIYD